VKKLSLTLAVFVCATAAGQELKPAVAFTLLIDDVGPLVKLKASEQKIRELIGKFQEAAQSGIVLIPPEDQSGPTTDFHRTDYSLAQRARAVGALYGLSVWLKWGTIKGPPPDVGPYMIVRVVRSDAIWTKPRITIARPLGKNETVLSVFSEMAKRAATELKLTELPVGIEAQVAPTPAQQSNSSPADQARGAPEPPPLPPPLVEAKKTEPVLRPVGYTAMIVGGAALVAGVVVFATTPRIHQDSFGYVLSQDASRALSAQRQQVAGVALMIAGGVVAAAGGITTLMLGENATVRAAFVPSVGGGSLVLGGDFR